MSGILNFGTYAAIGIESNPSLANRRGCPHFVSDLYMVRRGARLKTLCFYVN